jgi:2,5-furandicarboxylate decarboxylase 1
MLRRYGERGEPMPAAICIGVHPAIMMAGTSRGAFGDSELERAGGLLGEPVEMVEAETVPLEVIARSEFVIEGYLYPDRLVEDGPFGEYTGYYGSNQIVPIMELTAITMRRGAIYHDVFASHPDHNVGPLAREAQVYRSVKEFVPTVTAVHSPRCGSLYHVYVSIKKRTEGQGRLAGMAALAGDPNIKHVFVVDDDVDVRNEHEVLWAVATRFQADTNLMLSPNTTGATLDPTAYGEDRAADGTMTTKMIVDATKPVKRPFPERVSVPRDVLERLDLRQLVPGYRAPAAGNGARSTGGQDWWTTTKPGGTNP